ncbi:unnamed protein product [Orchesella dallaii]|uniref:Uncharacterized protein n=1 Tax=Orchesella dallaii TaxID=48710 RepID=A0ABP1RY28_9HEXA
MNRLGLSRPLHNNFIHVVSKRENIRPRKRDHTKILIEDNDQNIVTSCLFQEGEILDYDFVPTFPNYFYAFNALLLSNWNAKKHCYQDDLKLNPNKMKIAILAFRVSTTFLCGILIVGVIRTGTSGFDKITEWSLQKLLTAYADHLLEVFGTSQSNSTVINPPDHGIRIETILLGITGYSLEFSLCIALFIIKGMFLFAGITMKELTDKFVDMLKISESKAKVLDIRTNSCFVQPQA